LAGQERAGDGGFHLLPLNRSGEVASVAPYICHNIPLAEYVFLAILGQVDLIRIYECLCDRTRLRILNLLAAGPRCVYHLQAGLAEPQVKISKHLAYLKARGLVTVRREGSWMVYRLPAKVSRELRVNLACLQDCAAEDPVFRRDQARLARLAPAVPEVGACACPRTPSERR
jgi:ArsR family transcriptional regulator